MPTRRCRPVVLVVAGSDSGGGAGIQADQKAILAMGGFAATAITCLIPQNLSGVRAVQPADAAILVDQIDAVCEGFPVAAAKTGMLCSAELIEVTARALAARGLLGARALVGLSADTLQQVEAAAAEDVDYLGVGPVLPTSTKADVGPAWGADGYRQLRGRAPHPVVAIGGVTADVAGDVVRAGADGVAVVSAICAAADPGAAVRELRDEVDRALAERASSP